MQRHIRLIPLTLNSSLSDAWSLIHNVRAYQRDTANSCDPNRHGLLFRLTDVFLRTWYLGLTSFGGPPVHFTILHQAFVEGGRARKYAPWVSEQTYQDAFALSQATPGPASTKMLFIIALLRAGIGPAVVAFILWSLPGALTMLSLAIGVSKVQSHLPGPVCALLSGLNAAAVGIIALAAVQLSRKAIQDSLTRMLVIGGACAGLCYSALWYFPILIAGGGIITMSWDIYVSRWIGKLKARWRRSRRRERDVSDEDGQPAAIPLEENSIRTTGAQTNDGATPSQVQHANARASTPPASPAGSVPRVPERHETQEVPPHTIPSWLGVSLVVIFFTSLTAILSARGSITGKPLAFSLFSNMYLAGTLIFGGGPVVIPLLREYVVEPGWVSPRDFLIGIAVIQAMPGPNFNFAVYLGALAVINSGVPNWVGGILGFVGIFFPGIILALGLQSLWARLRAKAAVASALRGLNAVAVGMVFTAVYRLWEIGYITVDSSKGISLASEPWWVVVASVAYSGSAWFGVPAAVSIVGGGVLGLCRYPIAG